MSKSENQLWQLLPIKFLLVEKSTDVGISCKATVSAQNISY